MTNLRPHYVKFYHILRAITVYSEKKFYLCSVKIKTITIMSEAALTNLRDYLTGTLSSANMMWLGMQLTEYAKKEEDEQLRPFTMKEIDDMLDEAEADFDAGLGIPHEEVMRRWKERVANEKQTEMAEAV